MSTTYSTEGVIDFVSMLDGHPCPMLSQTAASRQQSSEPPVEYSVCCAVAVGMHDRP